MATEGRFARELVKDTNAGVAYPEERSVETNANIDASQQVTQLGDTTSTAQAMQGLVDVAQPLLMKGIENKARKEFKESYAKGVGEAQKKIDEQDNVLTKMLFGRSASVRGAQHKIIDNNAKLQWAEETSRMEQYKSLPPAEYLKKLDEDLEIALDGVDAPDMRQAIIDSHTKQGKSLARLHAQHHEVFKRQEAVQATMDEGYAIGQQLESATDEDDIQELETQFRSWASTVPDGMDPAAHADMVVQTVVNSLTANDTRLHDLAKETGLFDGSEFSEAQGAKLKAAKEAYLYRNAQEGYETRFDMRAAQESGNVEETERQAIILRDKYGLDIDVNAEKLKARTKADELDAARRRRTDGFLRYKQGRRTHIDGEDFSTQELALYDQMAFDEKAKQLVLDMRKAENRNVPPEQQVDVNSPISAADREEVFLRAPQEFAKIFRETHGKSDVLSGLVSKAYNLATSEDPRSQAQAERYFDSLQEMQLVSGEKLKSSVTPAAHAQMDMMGFFIDAGMAPLDATNKVRTFHEDHAAGKHRQAARELTDDDYETAWESAETVLESKARHWAGLGIEIPLVGWQPFLKTPGNEEKVRADFNAAYANAFEMVGPANKKLATDLAIGQILRSAIVVEESKWNKDTRMIVGAGDADQHLRGIGYEEGYQQFVEELVFTPKFTEALRSRGVPDRYFIDLGERNGEWAAFGEGIDVWHPDIEHTMLPGTRKLMLSGRGDGGTPWTYTVELPTTTGQRELVRPEGVFDNVQEDVENIYDGMKTKLGF